MMVGAFQFDACGDPERNCAALERGMEQAWKAGVRLLATQECGLCGYPPVEVESVEAIDWSAQSVALRRVAEFAQEWSMYVVVGMASRTRRGVKNSVRLITPKGTLGRPYHKRPLYGWDAENFLPGEDDGGVHVVDGIRVGLRICYEVRFPEYFRELFRRRVHLVVVSSADVGSASTKHEVMRAHLISRAAENATYVLAANSTSGPQLCPTCLIDPDGREVCSAPKKREALIVGEVEVGPPPLGRKGRIQHSSRLAALASD
jgi:predicted amidohydrolase